MAPAPAPGRIDGSTVRVLAHPLRSRIVSALRRLGPMTATALARELGTNSGATSYHLRRLAEVGLVTDTGAGDGRTRIWAASAPPAIFQPSTFADDEDAETALGWLSRDWLRHFTEKFARWLDVQGGWPLRWRDAAGMDDFAVVVTAEQLAQLRADLGAIVERYARVGQGNPQAKRVAVYTAAYLIDLDKVPLR
jgi:DNA-binding transcriptional ArsR family regulator